MVVATVGKLSSPRVRARIVQLAVQGHSLNSIRRRLAKPEPEGFGISVSRTAIYNRLLESGVRLKNQSFARLATPEPLAQKRYERRGGRSRTKT